MIETIRLGVPVQRVQGNVGAAANEPLVMDAVEFTYLGPGLAPIKLGGNPRPEGVRILNRAGVFMVPVLEYR
jgi:hypothetical protein